MQAITLAIGKQGITFFTQHYLLPQIQAALAKLSPPDRSMNLPGFLAEGGRQISKLNLSLTGGKLVNYAPAFQQVSQEMDSGNTVFKLIMGSNSFNAQYNWTESYHWDFDTVIWGKKVHTDGDESNSYDYTPGFSQLLITVLFKFLFDKGSNAWEVKVSDASGQSQGFQDNIPQDSILENQLSTDCKGSHVIDCTQLMINNVDIVSNLNKLLTDVIQTIPGSGNLGNDIVYDFSTGTSGVVFPDNKGIQIGVKGGASYKGTVFPGGPVSPTPLPIPPADSDTHHLNMYVSNFEIDALYWAFFQAGKLQRTVTPQDLPNPEALDVSTYVGWESALKIYADKRDVMNAVITPNSAPVTSFQKVYIYGTSAMALLKKQLPANIYDQIQSLASAPFLSQQDLDNFLTNIQVPSQYFTTIESAGQTPGMVVTHDLNFNLVIQDTQYNYPYINFKVNRTDILTDLCLGLTDKAQTLQFGFYNAVNSATFIDSSVPNFNGALDFGGPLWRATGETNYAECLRRLGTTGTPLPIMEGFKFDFTNAVLSIQENYVSILANVLYQNS